MGSHLEYLNKVAHLGRLNRRQLEQVGEELNRRVTRLLSRKRVYAYVVVTLPLDEQGHPIPGGQTVRHMIYEAKNEDAVYAAGQKEFEAMNTSSQLMIDTVVCIQA